MDEWLTCPECGVALNAVSLEMYGVSATLMTRCPNGHQALPVVLIPGTHLMFDHRGVAVQEARK